MIPLVVIGAGGFGREALDVAEAVNRREETYDILGVIDSNPSEANLTRLFERGIAYLGTEVEWFANAPEAQYVIGIGSPRVRTLVSAGLDEYRVAAATLVHPAAGIGGSTSIGAGTVICAGVQVSTNVRLGKHVHLNPNVTVGHDTNIDDFVSVNPGAIVSGDVVIETGSLIGAGAVVLQGLNVGARSTIGAAACVVRDVSEGCTVKGVPAR